MQINLNDLIVELDSSTESTLLRKWKWLVSDEFVPVLISCTGNIFLQNVNDNKIIVLISGKAEVFAIANSNEEFEELLRDDSFVENLFSTSLIIQLKELGSKLNKSQIYGCKELPLFGGEYITSNMYVVNIQDYLDHIGETKQSMRYPQNQNTKKENIMVEYKVVIYQEGMLGSLLLGGSKVNPVKFSEFLNKNAREGWRVTTMEKDIRRMLLLWKREAYVVIMQKEV